MPMTPARLRIIGASHDASPFAVAVFTAAIFALLPISTDLYLPALPALRQDFGISSAQSQLTLSAFIVGFGLAQLLYGPISDRFGRRPALLAGIVLYAVASVACILAPSIHALVAARFLQGVGACSGQVMARAIVRDLYPPEQGARVFAYMTFLFGLVPLFGPLIGGILTVWFGWRATFAFLLGFSLVVLAAVWFVLAETNRNPDPAATNVRRLAANARAILGNPTFIGYSLCVTFSYCGLFSFLSASSFVIIDVLGVPTEHFGLWFMIAVVGNMVGAVACSRLAHRLSLPRMLATAAALSFAGGSCMLALSLAGMANPWAIILPMALYMMGHGITTPVCFAAAVGPFPGMAGTASAVLGLMQLAVAAFVGQVVLRLHDGTTLPLAAAVALFGCAVLISEVLLVRRLS